MSSRFKQHDLNARIRHGRHALLTQLLLTVVIAVLVAAVSLSNLGKQAENYAAGIESDYDILMQEYVRMFDTVYCQIVRKIEENPSFEEMDSWLKLQDAAWCQAMGSDIYDGIGFTYKGGFARSWSYGDYSNYDPTSRRWYQTAEAAGGKTATLAPYVTYLDSQFADNESYILMSIVKKYSDEIYVDYDVKLPEIRRLMENRHSQYAGTALLLLDPDGYILSSSDSAQYAHRIGEPDSAISQSMSDTLSRRQAETGEAGRLGLASIDGRLYYLYTEQTGSGNCVCVLIRFDSVFVRDFLVIALLALLLAVLEVLLYRRSRRTLLEFRFRDERLTVISNAVFQERLFVDVQEMCFYGNSEAETICPDMRYSDLYAYFIQRIPDPAQRRLFDEFVSPEALVKASGQMFKLEKQHFPMNWRQEDGSTRLSTIEVSRLASVIDGRETVGILARDVSEDADMLKDALKQAEIASRAKGDFMSRMSHEIRTPLNAVIGYLDLAKDAQQDTEKLNHCLDQSGVAARHLLGVINNVLDISSIESGRMKIADDDFDLTQLIHSLTTIFYAQAATKKLQFEVSVNGLSEEWVRGDSLRLNQILLNLLSNAVKFTPEGGKIRLDVSQIAVHDEKLHLQFCVTDTGVGMSEEYRSRMFKPFEQESAETARKYGGTGLGLSISFNLIKIMGGEISVESEQGKGTRFIVSLPFGRAEKGQREHLSTQSFSGLRALAVDDDASACEYVEKLLNRCGVKCDVAGSGKKAVRRARSRMEEGKPYDLMIIDWNMPDQNGVETARQIRALCGSTVPIIIATSYDYSAIADEARAAGVNKIISKPLFQSTMFDLLVNTYGRYTPAQPEKAAPRADFKGMHIILAEDNEMNMEIACEILSKAGMQVTSAVNGREALEIFTASAPGEYGAILMDIQMPVMDGYEAARAIRKSAHPEAKTVPIIAMTANAFTSDVTAALAVGMNDHVAKPVSYERLFEALSRLTRPENK